MLDEPAKLPSPGVRVDPWLLTAYKGIVDPHTFRAFENEVLRGIGRPGERILLDILVGNFSTGERAAFGVSDTRAALLHLAEQGRVRFDGAEVVRLR